LNGFFQRCLVGRGRRDDGNERAIAVDFHEHTEGVEEVEKDGLVEVMETVVLALEKERKNQSC